MITIFCVIWQVMELLHLMELEQKEMVRQFCEKSPLIFDTNLKCSFLKMQWLPKSNCWRDGRSVLPAVHQYWHYLCLSQFPADCTSYIQLAYNIFLFLSGNSVFESSVNNLHRKGWKQFNQHPHLLSFHWCEIGTAPQNCILWIFSMFSVLVNLPAYSAV